MSGSAVDGFWDQIRDNNTLVEIRQYGEWYGNRYKDFPNVMYLLGGTRNPNSEIFDKINDLTEGLKTSDPHHLITYHAGHEYSSTDIWDPAIYSWLDFNATYAYSIVCYGVDFSWYV